MKKFTFNKQFMVLMFLLLNCFVSYAADEDLITQQITINLTEAGTLPNNIGSSKKNLITNLKIIGEINGTDLRFIREMAGISVHGYRTSGKLSVLDLSETRIVEGGAYYYNGIGYNCFTSNDRINEGTFIECTSLTSIKLPSSVTYIGEEAFLDCSSLTSINIPSSVTEIENGAFVGCTSLTSVNIPSSVTKIGGDAFGDCTSLTSVNIPSSVTKISDDTFSGCTSLTSVKIPSSVTYIGEEAFENCNSLKSIYIYAEDIPNIANDAFKGCDSKNCTIYVPKGTYVAYWLSEFGYFENIVEFDATSIHNTVAPPKAQETARYAVNGQRLTAPIKGINLVKYSDGTVKKEFVK